MLSREWLCRRRCVRDLIRIFDGVFLRAAARWPIALDEPTVGLLLLWTILRGERTFLLRALEQLGVDMWALTCDVDDLLRPSLAVASPDPRAEELDTALERPLWAWLDRTEQQAAALGHPYLSTEHLLLATLAAAEGSLAAAFSRHGLTAVLARHGLTFEKVANAVQAVLATGQTTLSDMTPESPPILAEIKDEPGAPAVGVPRRFSLATLMLTMVTYAMLLAGLRAGDIPTDWIVAVLILFTAAGIGQPILYGGKSPRGASALVGQVLFPVEVLALILYRDWVGGNRYHNDESVLLMFLALLGGGPLGYAAGCLAASMFFLNDWYEKFKRRRAAPDGPEPDPLAQEEGESTSHPTPGEGSA